MATYIQTPALESANNSSSVEHGQIFLATLVALHFTPVSDTVSRS